MIKANGLDADGNPALIMGLTPENLANLARGKPIAFNASELGLPPMTVIIMFGETVDELAKTLQHFPRIDK